jgi:signal transduction histidine kinase
MVAPALGDPERQVRQDALETLHFTVDSALLQELGERLIGQPHIALAELIKNSYDADARNCRVTFADNEIYVTDDGHGMSASEFRKYWIRIGSTHKIEQAVSRELKRPLTGAKGLGRLAVQFLASRLKVISTDAQTGRTITATVDWEDITPGEQLSQVDINLETGTEPANYPNGSNHGFRVVLSGLKHTWSEQDLRELGYEVWTLRSPLRRFGKSKYSSAADDFEVHVQSKVIEDAKDQFDAAVTKALENWKARISGELTGGRRGAKAVLALEFKANYPDGADPKIIRREIVLPVLEKDGDKDTPLLDRLKFEIRIYKNEGRQASGIRLTDFKYYLGLFGNVNVYDRGFRLPYYGTEHDWLEIAQEQASRRSVSSLLPSELSLDGSGDTRYMLDMPDPRRIFGILEIDTRHEAVAAGSGKEPGDVLTIQAGRDRLHDNAAYAQLRRLVRWALHFYANRYRARSLEVAERAAASDVVLPSEAQGRAIETLDAYKRDIPEKAFKQIQKSLKAAQTSLESSETRFQKRSAILAPLASAGMAALAANHEMARHRVTIGRIAGRLRQLRTKLPELGALADELEDIQNKQDALRRLFAPYVSAEDRDATSRLKVEPVVRSVVGAMRPLLPGVEFDFSGLDPEERFPNGAMAEWNALIQNVLANAWNAMLESKRKRLSFSSGAEGRQAFLRISDTGKGLGVSLDESSNYFEPFERGTEIPETMRSLALGGQGLGLAIVRMIAQSRNVEARFVQPKPGYATTFELSWRA